MHEGAWKALNFPLELILEDAYFYSASSDSNSESTGKKIRFSESEESDENNNVSLNIYSAKKLAISYLHLLEKAH